VVFDEIEKAHPDVANILLQILEEGCLTDGQGRVVNFKNTIIALTSNLGADVLYEPGSTNPDGSVSEAARNSVLREVGTFFKPELINRLDELVVFNKLPASIITDIVKLRIKEVASRLVPRRITLNVTEPAEEWLAKKGYSDKYGARAVTRVIRDSIANPLSLKLLDGSVKDGEIVEIHLKNDKLHITSRPDPAVATEPLSEEDKTREVIEDSGEVP
jgi:ATP-dependent Clp protease ATP-binding subunit ClpB